MTWFLRLTAPLALLILIGIGVYLIVADHIYSGLGLLALTVPLEWMGVIPEPATSHVDGAPYDQDVEQPPLLVLLAFFLAGLCFILATITLR